MNMSDQGGKAANLARIQQAGAPVPAFTVLPGDWTNRVLRELGCLELLPMFDKLAEDFVRIEVGSCDPAGVIDDAQRAVEQKCLAVSDTFEHRIGANLPAWARCHLATTARQLRQQLRRPDWPLVLRSSATVEDGASAAFPGQFETRLGLTSDDDLTGAATACLASLLSARSCRYRLALRTEEALSWLYGYPVSLGEWRAMLRPNRRSRVSAYSLECALTATRRRSGTLAGSCLALVLQEMVIAVAAGVAFCPGPTEGAEDLAVVQGVIGLGESLVDSQVVPDTWSFTSTGQLADSCLGSKETKVVLGPRGPRRVPCTSAERAAWSVPAATAQEVAAWAWRLRQELGWAGIDLEWAYGANGLTLLQARPQTGLRPVDVLAVAAVAARQTPAWYSGGETASEGAVSAPLVIAQHPSDVPPIAAILVVPATEKEWENRGALFHAVGIVAERGGHLSHAAIFCRERGLPCLIGAAGCLTCLSAKSGQMATLDATRRMVFPGRLPLEQVTISPARRHAIAPAEDFRSLQQRGWGAVVGGRECLIRVKPPIGSRFTLDAYARAFKELDALLGTRHEVLTTPDGGVYTPWDSPGGARQRLDALTLDETPQLLHERQEAIEEFLDSSFAPADRFDVAIWARAHIRLVVFQHISASWAKSIESRLTRALSVLGDAGQAHLLALNKWPTPSETTQADREFAALVAMARGLPRFEAGSPSESWAAVQMQAPDLAAAIEHHATWYRHGSADPSLPIPVEHVTQKVLASAAMPAPAEPIPPPARPVADGSPLAPPDAVTKKLLFLAAWQAHLRESEHHLKVRGLRRAVITLETMRPSSLESRLHELALDELVEAFGLSYKS